MTSATNPSATRTPDAGADDVVVADCSSAMSTRAPMAWEVNLDTVKWRVLGCPSNSHRERRGPRCSDVQAVPLEEMKMMTRPVIGVVVALLVSLVGGPAGAQDDVKAAKGVSVRNAVTSLGPFSATINAPLFISGTSVTLEPGGRTGR